MSSVSNNIETASSEKQSTRSRRARTWFYQTETLRPIVCLYYVIPFLFIYELGVIFLDNFSIRNGLDVWLAGALRFVGVGELLLLPLLTTFTLFALHHFRRDHWIVSPVVLLGMVIESFGLALIVLCAAKAQHLFLLQYSHSQSQLPLLEIIGLIAGESSGETGLTGLASRFVSFCGAGLYEELVFRLLMLPGIILLLRKTGMNLVTSSVIAIAATSLLFAAAHYDFVNPAGESFEFPGFMVRVVASIFFCVVFLFRGFGVAVGTHVAYDVLTQL